MVLFIILAFAWAWYLVTWAKSRRETRGVNSISSFSHHLSVLERTSPARPGRHSFANRPSGRPEPIFPAASYTPPRPPMSISAARRRRRSVLYVLAALAVSTLVLIPFAGTTMIALQVLTDLMLVGYLALLVRGQRHASERRSKVHYLPNTVAATEPQYLLQRSANY